MNWIEFFTHPFIVLILALCIATVAASFFYKD